MKAEEIRSYPIASSFGPLEDCAFMLREIAAQLADLNEALPRSGDKSIALPVVLCASNDDIPVRIKP
jgi:hypothetical protein